MRKLFIYLCIYLFLDIIYSTYDRKTHTAMYHATQQTIRYLFSKVSCPASNIVTLALSPGKWNGRWEFFQCQISCNCICIHNLLLVCVVANEVELPWNGHASLFFVENYNYTLNIFKKDSVYLMSFFFQIRAFLTNCVQTEIMINKSIASMK